MSTSPGPTKLGVAPNIGGLLCYAPCGIGLIFSIVAVIIEKENRFLRFHAFQSLLVHAGAFVAWIALWILVLILSTLAGVLGLLGSMLMFVLGIGLLVLTVIMMIKAYNGEEYALPTIGDMARQWV
jgi:uncharacterized membrane protein